VLVLTLTACGGDDSAERTEEWAKNVCDQVQPQVARIQAANEAIAQASESEGEPAEVQAVYSSSYEELSGAFESLADAVDGAGDPPVSEGEELRTDAVAELNGLSESYEELKTASDELDTSDRAKFAEGLRGMVGQLEALGQSGDEALAELQSGELGEAMARQKGCQSPAPTPGGDGGEDGGEEGEDGGEEGEDGTEENGTYGSEDDGAGDADASGEGGEQNADGEG
jgi:hypothetical protein